jgi:hypothetical protein
MALSDFLPLRPTHIEQKIGGTGIALLPLSVISKLQAFKIPVLRSLDIEEFKGWFLATKLSSVVSGISFNVTEKENFDKVELILDNLIKYLQEIHYDLPFFIEAELELSKLDREPQSVFYYLLQSYFTAFNLSVKIENYQEEIEYLNLIHKPIRELEFSFTLTLNSEDDLILKHLDDFVKSLSVFRLRKLP